MNFLLQKFLRVYLGSPEGQSDVGQFTTALATFHGYEQGSPSDTRDYVNDLIPTFEEIEQSKDSFLFEQGSQELAARFFRFALPWPVKFALEAYTLYDYFDLD